MSFLRYPGYKDSGVAWLGSIPVHWEIEPLKAVASCNDDVLSEDTTPEHEIEYIEISDVAESRGILRTQPMRFCDAPSRARRVVVDGDVLISTVRTYLRAIATIQNPPPNVVASTGFAAIRPRNVLPKFLGYMLHCEFLICEVISQSVGVSYPAINSTEIMRIKGPIPPAAEQAAIAAFLDRETAKIDALIAEQERLIDLLHEKRQSVISHAVTKGLNPDAPVKLSGVEWLGEVPAHWTVSRLKYVTELIVDCPHETPVYDADGKYFVIRTADIDEGSLSSLGMYRLSEQEYLRRIRRQALLPGDIVYGREGERWGHAALVPTGETYCLGQRMMQFRADSETDAAFLMWQLNAACTYHQGEVDTVGATSPHVNVETIRNLVLTHPPLSEQRTIAAHLEASVGESNRLITVARDAMTLLGERRSALISAAVTGQIDVRGPGEQKAA